MGDNRQTEDVRFELKPDAAFGAAGGGTEPFDLYACFMQHLNVKKLFIAYSFHECLVNICRCMLNRKTL